MRPVRSGKDREGSRMQDDGFTHRRAFVDRRGFMNGKDQRPAAEKLRRVKVLLVEDEALIADLVVDVLTEYGFDVRPFVTADDALKYLEADDNIDVLFTDINLPGSMDGVELAQRARALRPELPVVYASGRHTTATAAPLVSHSLFLHKPYRAEDVCALLDRLTIH
jgi:DNA-binding NtrC family response regulator